MADSIILFAVTSAIHVCTSYLLNKLEIYLNLKPPWSSRQCVDLLDEKPGFEFQVRHQNKIRKVFLRRFPLSGFLAKTLRVNKIAMKSFS